MESERLSSFPGALATRCRAVAPDDNRVLGLKCISITSFRGYAKLFCLCRLSLFAMLGVLASSMELSISIPVGAIFTVLAVLAFMLCVEGDLFNEKSPR